MNKTEKAAKIGQSIEAMASGFVSNDASRLAARYPGRYAALSVRAQLDLIQGTEERKCPAPRCGVPVPAYARYCGDHEEAQS